MEMLKKAILCWLLLIDSCRQQQAVEAGLPAPPQFFSQIVDHLMTTPAGDDPRRYYSQRYYTYDQEFQGPGSPIIVILGGEGSIEPHFGIMYNVVAERYAVTLGGAFIVTPEHRFYGESQPVSREDIQKARDEGLPDPRLQLLTTEQALYDAVRLIRYIQTSLGCSLRRGDATYCPVLAVGGSYPGFMAASIRLRFPNVIDMAWAASAPMKFYSQQTPQGAYFEHITHVAETAHPGCTRAVRDTFATALQEEERQRQSPTTTVAFPSSAEWGLCPPTVPPYAAHNDKVLAEEVAMMVAILFANSNMAYYPPSNNSRLWNVCHDFIQGSSTHINKDDDGSNNDSAVANAVATIRNVLVKYLAPDGATCLDMQSQLPTGPHASVSAGDWSGVGHGPGGESWDFVGRHHRPQYERASPR